MIETFAGSEVLAKLGQKLLVQKTVSATSYFAISTFAVLGALGMLVGCSSSSSSGSSKTSTLTAETAVDWFGNAMEVVHSCQDSLNTFTTVWIEAGKASDGSDSSASIVTAAGQGIENCTGDEVNSTNADMWAAMQLQWPEATTILSEWTAAVVVALRDALVVGATNFDSSKFMGEAVNAFRDADSLAASFQDQLIAQMSSVGISVPQGDILHHFNPPDH